MNICTNCTLEILGITCADIHGKDICFYCFNESQMSTDGTISCPQCYGAGSRSIYFASELAPGFENSIIGCDLCLGAKRIPKADVGAIELERVNLEVKHECDECPF